MSGSLPHLCKQVTSFWLSQHRATVVWLLHGACTRLQGLLWLVFDSTRAPVVARAVHLQQSLGVCQQDDTLLLPTSGAVCCPAACVTHAYTYRHDLYLPTNPEARVKGHIPSSGAVMQSAAKVGGTNACWLGWLLHQRHIIYGLLQESRDNLQAKQT